MARVLADDSQRHFTVGEVVRTLGNSGGAIGNALEKLVARGEAVRIADNPRTYRANAATAAAAQTVSVTPSAQRQRGRPGTGAKSAAPPAATAARQHKPAPPSASAPAPTGAQSGRPSPITRPNGMKYHPRELAQMPDVEALRNLRKAGVPVLLYGPPGTGKTSVIEAAFPDLITLAGDGDTEVADLIGEYTQREGGGYEFVYGPLVTAMQEGRALLVDDATLISPKVLAALYPAMDGRRQIQVKAHKGETITAAEGFYVIAGHNPGVHGAVLTEALASRFSVQIQVGSDYDLAEALKIRPKAVTIARNLARLQEKGEVGWAPQLRELLAFQKVEAVLGAEAAFANLIGIAPLEDRDVVADLVRKVTGHRARPLSLGRQL
ncbi:AAA family ATPase [Streptomyces sp. B15]|uniref:AAA family ATPase n=2 Tax=unclassified Streptomyces TaxID=2593676 RepID=UPI001B36DDDC|nr:AAA family ATPase [Streptomyces sp. B15]MBQ1121866.1 AAA family ATPase [Streptomyces sp. B15]